MIVLVLALMLVVQDPEPGLQASPQPPAETTPGGTPAAPTEPVLPTGAPRDDYGLVGWCFGALEGYVAQHDRVMPDVERIEAAYRRPGSSLADDLKVYADQQVQARAHLRAFTEALQTAERASLSALRPRAEAAISKGRALWAPAANLPTRAVAQQWMGWTLPQACPAAAERLTRNAVLLGAAFDPSSAVPEPEPQSAIPAPANLEAAGTPPPQPSPAPAADPVPEAPFEAPQDEGAPILRKAPDAP